MAAGEASDGGSAGGNASSSSREGPSESEDEDDTPGEGGASILGTEEILAMHQEALGPGKAKRGGDKRLQQCFIVAAQLENMKDAAKILFLEEQKKKNDKKARAQQQGDRRGAPTPDPFIGTGAVGGGRTPKTPGSETGSAEREEKRARYSSGGDGSTSKQKGRKDKKDKKERRKSQESDG